MGAWVKLYYCIIAGCPVLLALFFGSDNGKLGWSNAGMICGAIISLLFFVYIQKGYERDEIISGVPEYNQNAETCETQALRHEMAPYPTVDSSSWESLQATDQARRIHESRITVLARRRWEERMRKQQEDREVFAVEAQRIVDQFLEVMQEAGNPGIQYERFTDRFRNWGGWSFEIKRQGDELCLTRRNAYCSFVRMDGWWQLARYWKEGGEGSSIGQTKSPVNNPTKDELNALRDALYRVLRDNGVSIPLD